MKHYRIEDQTPLKAKRLVLTPLSARELSALIEREADERLKGSYGEMHRDVTEHPDQALWYTGWRISLRQSGEPVGLLSFHGMAADRTVNLTCDIAAAHRGSGYAEEATKAICGWAFSQENVYFIRALADGDNAASNHILEKMKFYRIESPLEGKALWELERPASSWIAVYMSIGLALGLAFGTGFFGNMALGMAVGLGAGVALGAAMDSQDRAARKREHEPKKLDQEKK
ncbi:MAG: GNAT family N-acetyltransferase [Clostridiales bacterium]|nr:GNAT family N-acetyltransferase [Clostridiales bacterium]